MNTTTGLLRRPALTRAPRALPRPSSGSFARWLTAHWHGIALAALLLLTGVAYIWNLSASGDANSFYAAAVQAGTRSWKAFFFGSLDSSSFITVDKPPASLWVMALSGRVFGFSSWSMLIPQALEGVAAVTLLYAAIKRWFGAGAGLAAGALLAVTPVAALMFRFNNPDALLVLLLIAAAYCLTRALERAGTRWVVAAGTMIGFAFLAKMMQAFLVLPAFALVYMTAAPTGLRRRIWQMLAGGAAIAVSAGWWVAIVALWPVGSRPLIDGSSDNSILNLITGYNGLGRIFGASGPGGGGGAGAGAGATFSGPTGFLRLFNSVMGGQASWLLPVALLAFGAGLVLTRRAPRTDRARAALLPWGGWLIVSGLVFSLSSGVIHTYYTVALAPAIVALVAIGGRMLWDRHASARARVIAGGAVAVTAGWAWELLDRTPSWLPWLRTLIILVAGGCLAALLAASLWRPMRRRLAGVAVVLGLVASLAGPVAYSGQTATTSQTGSVPSAGPASAGGLRGVPGALPTGAPASGAGRFGGQATVSAALKRALEAGAGHYRWVAATLGSQSAASLELATGGDPVMAIGGFSNQGGNITLAQFQRHVRAGEVHYYIASAGGGPGGGGSSSAITTWVKTHYQAVTIGGETVYDLAPALS